MLSLTKKKSLDVTLYNLLEIFFATKLLFNEIYKCNISIINNNVLVKN